MDNFSFTIVNSSQECFIVRTTLSTEASNLTADGIANAQSAGSDDITVIQQKAYAQSLENINKIKSEQSNHSPARTTKQVYPESPQANKVKDYSRSGGGNKAISEKQILLIENLARNQNRSAEGLAQERYNKPIDILTGSEANEIIQSLKR